MKLGQTDLVQNVNVRIFGGTDFIRVRASRNLGETDHMNSVRTISVIGK